jgi:NitT/TauT family transport system substrate-binding protein
MAIVDLTRLTRLAAPLALFVLLVASSTARAETAIHFSLGRKIDGTAAPFFLAVDRGYFKDEGLDVTIDTAPRRSLDVINRLAAGNDDMGVADINTLIEFRDAGNTPIKAVFVVFDKPPYAIIARKSRGIAVPGDLPGKKLGVTATDPAFAQWPIFATVNDIDAAKVAVETIGLPVREPMLAAGEVDAIIGCGFTAYVDLKAHGVPADDLVLLPMADYGLALYGDAIMVAPGFAQDKPAATRGFLRAYLKALQDTVRDPQSAVEAVLRRDDGAGKIVELERLRMAIADNIVTAAVKINGYGDVDAARLAAAVDQLALVYPFKAKDKAAAVFDPSFLPPAAERSVSEAASH